MDFSQIFKMLNNNQTGNNKPQAAKEETPAQTLHPLDDEFPFHHTKAGAKQMPQHHQQELTPYENPPAQPAGLFGNMNMEQMLPMFSMLMGSGGGGSGGGSEHLKSLLPLFTGNTADLNPTELMGLFSKMRSNKKTEKTHVKVAATGKRIDNYKKIDS